MNLIFKKIKVLVVEDENIIAINKPAGMLSVTVIAPVLGPAVEALPTRMLYTADLPGVRAPE